MSELAKIAPCKTNGEGRSGCEIANAWGAESYWTGIYGIGGFSISTLRGERLPKRGIALKGHCTIVAPKGQDVYRITNATMTGGTINNSGRIDNLTYEGGTYNARSGLLGETGTIGRLTLAGDSAQNSGNWGNVENLRFDNNGNGILSIAAFVNDTPMVQTFSTESTGASLGFTSSINAGSINLTNGNLALNLTGIDEGLYTSFLAGVFISDFFDNTTAVTGIAGLGSLQLIRDEEWFYVLNDGVFGSGWDLNFSTGLLSWNGTAMSWNGGDDNVVPAPATLAIVALGLAGLGYVRSRRKRNALAA